MSQFYAGDCFRYVGDFFNVKNKHGGHQHLNPVINLSPKLFRTSITNISSPIWWLILYESYSKGCWCQTLYIGDELIRSILVTYVGDGWCWWHVCDYSATSWNSHLYEVTNITAANFSQHSVWWWQIFDVGATVSILVTKGPNGVANHTIEDFSSSDFGLNINYGHQPMG